jgi:hypothetical protein
MSKSPIWLDDYEMEVLRGYLGELLDNKQVPEFDLRVIETAYNQTLDSKEG